MNITELAQAWLDKAYELELEAKVIERRVDKRLWVSGEGGGLDEADAADMRAKARTLKECAMQLIEGLDE